MTPGEPPSEQEITTLVPGEPQTEREETGSISEHLPGEGRHTFLTPRELPEGEDPTHVPRGPWSGEAQPLSLSTPILRGTRQQSEQGSLAPVPGASAEEKDTHPSLEAPG